MIIVVTQDDIDNGEDCHAYRCPVALAIKRQTGIVFQVHDTAAYQGISKVELPEDVKQFIDDFDSHREVAPFSFQFDIETLQPVEAR